MDKITHEDVEELANLFTRYNDTLKNLSELKIQMKSTIEFFLLNKENGRQKVKELIMWLQPDKK